MLVVSLLLLSTTNRRARNGGAVGAVNSTLAFVNVAFIANEARNPNGTRANCCGDHNSPLPGHGGAIYLDNKLCVIIKGKGERRERRNV